MKSTTRFAVFASGRGTNFEAIVRAGFRDSITVLVSDQNQAPALEIARNSGISTLVSRDEDAILRHLKETNTEFVVLAGYMRILSEKFIESFRTDAGYSRIINIHPSLLPAFPGLHSYQQAFDYGCKETGVTVHFVEAKVDSGPILAQKTFSISDCKNVHEVEEKGLRIEHHLYPETLHWVLSGDFKTEMRNGRLRVYPV